jgi:GH15 family glucan-1,4-alpha-glucosidase
MDLALIGNGAIGLLVDPTGTIVWGCFPRFDGDATFCGLLDDPPAGEERGIYAVEIVDLERAEQFYVTNTAVLVTRLFDASGGAIEITDCVPRFIQHGRVFRPVEHVRTIRRLAGSPRVRIRLRPAASYGRSHAALTTGSSHIRYVMPAVTLRLTTDASLTAVIEERPFYLGDTITLLLGPDETVPSAVDEVGRRFIEETTKYWRDWVRRLAIPFEWQAAVIRAAITLQLNAYDDTGAIVAAMTTSIPEAAGTARNWDYRYCWLRDGYFVVDALNRLGATETMEGYLRYIVGIVGSGAGGETLQPVYRINGDFALHEEIVPALPGYRGMGPVRVGNDAYRQVQHDVYGSAVLAATHVFFDERLVQRGDMVLFGRLEALGRRALAVFDQPDAGLWELRKSTHVHTFSSVMCWAACDRLARIAAQLGNGESARTWRNGAERVRRFIDEKCWNDTRRSFVSTAGGDALDASLLLLSDLGFVSAGDPRFVGTVEAIERELLRGDFMFRYVQRDDFGVPENAFVVCSFWYANALAAVGRRATACAPQPARPARGAYRSDDRRVVGELRPDLQHGRADHDRDTLVAPLERRGLM